MVRIPMAHRSRFAPLAWSALLFLTALAGGASSASAQDRAPVVTAPATWGICLGRPGSFVVSAADPDADPITSFTAAPLPSGATFTTNSFNASGTFTWTPTTAQGGVSVTFTASNDLSGSATTLIVISICDVEPSVTAPATMSGSEGVTMNFTVQASYPDGPITTLTASGLPLGATFTSNATHTSGSFSWTPSYTQAGTYHVTFTAVTGSGLLGSASTILSIANVDRRPVVIGPANVTHLCQDPSPIVFTVSASDPDGEAITSFTASPLPSGATFTTNASNTSGTFQWTPSIVDVGIYPVTFTATNGSSGSFTTSIFLQCFDRAPVVFAPAAVTVPLNTLLTFLVTAADPDGDALVNLFATSLPSGATFTSNAAHTSGTFAWTPDVCQLAHVTFTATNALSGSASTDISVCGDLAPVVTAPLTVSGSPGTLLSFMVTASDPDGNPITSLTAGLLPSGATFTTNATNTSGTFAWTPSVAQMGTFTVTFTATAGPEQGTATTVITVLQGSAAPTARAGGPYTGVPGVPVEFNGLASTDPEGAPLTYLWNFGDLSTGVGPTPSHTYALPGTYGVVLSVSDGLFTDTDVTTATITNELAVQILTRNKSRRIRLSGSSFSKTWCAQIETVPGTFGPEDVDPSSIRLLYGAGGIASLIGKQGTVTDVDDDGVPELQACFLIADLQGLGFPQGTNTVLVTITGSLTNGAEFQGTLSIEVQNGSGGSAVARIVPNPLNPQGALFFETRREGRLTVQLFDLAGRLVRTLVDEPAARSGSHEVRVDGRDASGAPLASGIYFYRIRSADGSTEGGRVTILK